MKYNWRASANLQFATWIGIRICCGRSAARLAPNRGWVPYGVCLHCEEDISPKRVNAVPWAAYCIKCQEQVDRHEIEVDDSADLFANAA